MPRNTSAGIIIGGLAFLFGFGLVWHMWWLAMVAFIGIIVTMILRSLDEDTEYVIAADELAKEETARARRRYA